MYSSKEALSQAVAWICLGLSAEKVEFSFKTLFNDDCEQHSPRRAWMRYDRIYVVKIKNGAWIFAFGEPGGKSYLFDGLEADLFAMRVEEWPIDDKLLWKIIRYNPVIPTSNCDSFRCTLLASQNGKLVQSASKKFDLLPWSTETFAKGVKFSPEHLPPMRDGGNCFSAFLPESTVLNRETVRLITLRVMDFMFNN